MVSEIKKWLSVVPDLISRLAVELDENIA